MGECWVVVNKWQANSSTAVLYLQIRICVPHIYLVIWYTIILVYITSITFYAALIIYKPDGYIQDMHALLCGYCFTASCYNFRIVLCLLASEGIKLNRIVIYSFMVFIKYLSIFMLYILMNIYNLLILWDLQNTG